jgi:uncharacterized membrane protein
MKNSLTFNFFNEKDNLITTTTNLLSLLDVKVSHTEISDSILSNTNYPSLLSISESIKKWDIDSEAYSVAADKLHDLPVPFICYLKSGAGSFTVVKKVEEAFVTYLSDNGTEIISNLNDFINQWNNTVLLVEASEKSGEINYSKNKKQELYTSIKTPALLLLLAITGAISFYNSAYYFNGTQLPLYIGLYTCTVLGSIVTALLMLYEYDHTNPYLKKICSVNKKTNCNAILNSKGSKILGLSWSEIGFFYFAGAYLYLSISNTSAFFLNPVILLNIVVLPYVVFSVYYQALVIKQWCVLCLAVQFLLVAEFSTSLLTHHVNKNLFYGWEHIQYNCLFLAYLLPFSIWMIVKPYLYNAKEDKATKYNFKRFKNNPEVFNSLLLRQTAIKANPEGLGITLGNPEAENTLIKVCNPYCGPCAKSFSGLADLLFSNYNQWKVQIIFTATADKNDNRAIPVAHFLQIYKSGNDSNTIKVLGDWYNAKTQNYDDYQAKYPVEVDFENQKTKLAAMSNWCRNEDIQFTPTYYVNGHLLPESYDIGDLKNIY